MTLKQKLLNGLLILLALGCGTAVQKRLPEPASIRNQIFIREAALNEPVKLRVGEVRALGVKAAPELTNETNQLAVAPEKGIFLAVTLEFTADQRPSSLLGVAVISEDERTFGGTPPVGRETCATSQPGIPIRCQVIIEMDRQALKGAKLWVSANAIGEGEGDDAVMFDLGITAAQAQQLTSQTEPLAIQTQPSIQER